MTNFWRPIILVRLQDLYACDAASTACSNSELVVWGTRESSVWVDYDEGSGPNDKFVTNILTGSRTSTHSEDLLSTNSPPIKFFVVPPVADVPFHPAEICSALGSADALKAERTAEVEKAQALSEGRRESLETDMVWWELGESKSPAS